MDIFNTRTSQSPQVLCDIQLHHTSEKDDSTGRQRWRKGREGEHGVMGKREEIEERTIEKEEGIWYC